MRSASGFYFLIFLFAAHSPSVAKPVSKQAAPGICKTLKGEFVGFGEQTTRGDAEKALEREIAAWEQRSGLKAAPKDRNVACKVYIGWLNEFECKAEATVCRSASAKTPSKAPAKRRF
jgi:hypothetical protein